MNSSVVCLWYWSLKLFLMLCILLITIIKSLLSKHFLSMWLQAFVKQPVSFQQVEVTCARRFRPCGIQCELFYKLEKAVTTFETAMTTLLYVRYPIKRIWEGLSSTGKLHVFSGWCILWLNEFFKLEKTVWLGAFIAMWPCTNCLTPLILSVIIYKIKILIPTLSDACEWHNTSLELGLV